MGLFSRVLTTLTVVTLFLAVPSVAHAHSTLQSSTPGPSDATAVSSTGPQAATAVGVDSLELRFDGAVTIPINGIRLFQSSGEQRRVAEPRTTEGGTVVTADTGRLAEGTYVVAWRAVSADSHPIAGAFAFQVGSATGADTEALVQRVLADSGAPVAVGAVFAGVRFFSYAALAVLAGGLIVTLWLWPAGWRFGRLRRLLWTALGLAAAATVVGLGIQGAYSGGLGLGAAVDPTVVQQVLGERFGQAWVARLTVLALIGVALLRIPRTGEDRATWRPTVVSRVLLTALAVAALLPSSLVGHAAVDEIPVAAVLADLAHFTAIAMWVGGLVVMASVVLPKASAEESALVIPRFSNLAAIAVLAIIVTGVFQSWRRVGSFSGLLANDYGELLFVKILLFGLMLAIGAMSRRWVRRRYAVEAATHLSSAGAAYVDTNPKVRLVAGLRQSVKWEAAIAAVVLLVTSLLVNTDPAIAEELPSFSTEMVDPDGHIAVTVVPSAVGRSDLHFYGLTPRGSQLRLNEFSATLTLPDKDIGPLVVTSSQEAPDHYSANGFLLPTEGAWQLRVTAKSPAGGEIDVSTELPVARR